MPVGFVTTPASGLALIHGKIYRSKRGQDGHTLVLHGTRKHVYIFDVDVLFGPFVGMYNACGFLSWPYWAVKPPSAGINAPVINDELG